MVPLALFFPGIRPGVSRGWGRDLTTAQVSLDMREKDGHQSTDDYSKEARGTSLWMPHDSDKRTSRRRTYLYAVLFGILECGCVTGGVNGGG